jgi:hypothetical protein
MIERRSAIGSVAEIVLRTGEDCEGPMRGEFCAWELDLHFADGRVIALSGCHDSTPSLPDADEAP